MAHVLTSVRSCHSARRTSSRASPSTCTPIDSSAADSTCACTPSVLSTASAKLRRSNLGTKRCCSNLQACTCSHVNETINYGQSFRGPFSGTHSLLDALPQGSATTRRRKYLTTPPATATLSTSPTE